MFVRVRIDNFRRAELGVKRHTQGTPGTPDDFLFLSLSLCCIEIQVERCDMMSAYHRRLTGTDPEVQLKCAQRWSAWEMATSRLIQDHDLIKRAEKDAWALQFARIEV